jgi:hypothetical protein
MGHGVAWFGLRANFGTALAARRQHHQIHHRGESNVASDPLHDTRCDNFLVALSMSAELREQCPHDLPFLENPQLTGRGERPQM